jgi:UDP-N-acetylmuramoyl-tripeptide--D-alanyl-D-alanine ligase
VTLLFLAVQVFWLVLSLWHMLDLMQYLQQHEYLSLRFLNWSRQHWIKVARPVEWVVLLWLLTRLIPPILPASKLVLFTLIIWLVTALISVYLWARAHRKAIKPLAVTARVKRLIAGAFVLLLVEAALLYAAFFGFSQPQFPAWNQGAPITALFWLLALWLVSQLSVFNLVLANWLNWPVEEALRQYYIRSAQKIIRQVNPIVIGVTGSYGKTSTKEILAHVLGSRYEVLKTPRTFNTILGVCKVIREELKPNHRYFIVEMGAYKPGEIARICRLVKPQIGILTAVGPQHLERFKTVENIAKAKFELIQALPQSGIAIFNGDDPICRDLAQKSPVKALCYGLSVLDPALDLLAKDVETTPEGSQFELFAPGHEPVPARMRLLGRHNISNALAAVLAGLQCGLALRDASRALASVPQMEHRLQLIPAGGGIITLDNAYNSNPAGAQVALEVLSSFKTGRKVLVTPGFAELGSIEAAEHARLGERAAQVCDLIFLIGSPQRTDQILQGIQSHNFDPARVFCFPRLKDARQKMSELLQPGDIVLFENDLTDIY